MEQLIAQLLESWQIHNRIHGYLLDAIEEAHLADKAASKGRSVAEQFAHIHNVRLMWLKVAAPELHATQTKLEKDPPLTRAALQAALKESADAVQELLAQAFASGKVKGFKPSPSAFMSYLIAHEAHHRGQILLALKECGHPIDQKTQYGLWEWGVR